MKSVWTPQEDSVLIELYADNETEFIAQIVNKTRKQVGRRANILELRKSKVFISSQKSRIATKNKKCSFSGCCKKHEAKGFCRNHYALFLRGTIDINGDGTIQKKNTWDEKQIKLLKKSWPHSTLSELKEIFPEKSEYSIKVKAGKLKLKKTTTTWERCHKEKITEDFRVKQSCVKRGISIEEFDGFITSQNIRIRQSEKYRLWRASIYKRDDFTCQICLVKSSGDLNAHHIISLRKLLKDYKKDKIDFDDDYFYDIKNGITLCETCHENLHKEKGYK